MIGSFSFSHSSVSLQFITCLNLFYNNLFCVAEVTLTIKSLRTCGVTNDVSEQGTATWRTPFNFGTKHMKVEAPYYQVITKMEKSY